MTAVMQSIPPDEGDPSLDASRDGCIVLFAQDRSQIFDRDGGELLVILPPHISGSHDHLDLAAMAF